MNWLAHIFLSEYHIEFQIGNYLADPLKGKAWDNASIHLKNGMKVHTLIDSYTDQHALFKQSKQRLAQHGLLRGIVIDLTYDYLLTKNWNSFCNMTQEKFLETFYDNAYAQLSLLPSHASTPLKRMIDFDLLNKYQTINDLYQAFLRVDKRLSERLKKRDQTVLYYEQVLEQIDELEEDFMLFFPQLSQKVKEHTNQENLLHWRI